MLATWREYVQKVPAGPDRLGENSHRNLLHLVTATQRAARAGVNYVEGKNLHDPLDKLLQIAVENPVWDVKLFLPMVKYLLKTEYLHRHACSGDAPSHCPRHALLHEETGGKDCESCQLVFMVLDDLKRVCDQKHHVLVGDCADHFMQYMGYQMRVRAARDGMALLEAKQSPHDVRCQLDFMMTFQPLFALETTVKFFGKRGMLLHGTEARFMAEDKSVKINYFNHIAMSDMKQDCKTVLVVFESKVRMAKRVDPFSKRVSIYHLLACLFRVSRSNHFSLPPLTFSSPPTTSPPLHPPTTPLLVFRIDRQRRLLPGRGTVLLDAVDLPPEWHGAVRPHLP